jgi:hypothetical protein
MSIANGIFCNPSCLVKGRQAFFQFGYLCVLLCNSLRAIVMAPFQQLEGALFADRAIVKPVFLDVAHLAAPQLSAIFGLQRVGAPDGRTAVTVLAPLLDDIPVIECQFAFDHYHLASRTNPTHTRSSLTISGLLPLVHISVKTRRTPRYQWMGGILTCQSSQAQGKFPC